VVASGRASQESALQYMKVMLDMYQNAYRAMPNLMNPFDLIQKSRSSVEEKPGNTKTSTASNESAKARQQEREDDPVEVTELKNRVAELEKLVSKLVPEKTNSKRK
jgi:hypothetical protein